MQLLLKDDDGEVGGGLYITCTAAI